MCSIILHISEVNETVMASVDMGATVGTFCAVTVATISAVLITTLVVEKSFTKHDVYCHSALAVTAHFHVN